MKKEEKSEQEFSIKKVKEMIEQDRRAREQRAIEKINKILAEERCMIKPYVILSDNNVRINIEIVALMED